MKEKTMSRFSSPNEFMEAAFRNAAFFSITSFRNEGGKRIINKAQTKDWEQAHKCGIVLQKLNRTCTIYVVSRDNTSVFLPPEAWNSLDEIWREQLGDCQTKTSVETRRDTADRP